MLTVANAIAVRMMDMDVSSAGIFVFMKTSLSNWTTRRLCRALVVLMVLLTPINVKAESGLCGFCSDKQIAGELLIRRGKLYERLRP